MATKTKVEKTETIVAKAIEKAGGADKLNRAKILKTLQSRKGLEMSPAQASTYYHNALKKLAE